MKYRILRSPLLQRFIDMHREYIREIPESKTAVLFIHGILGTPDHFIDFVKEVPREYSVYNILLDGHGKGVAEFSKSSMKKWRRQAKDIAEKLCRKYENIIIAAHSMGTLFAIELAIKHAEKVKFLFLLACPMKVGLRFSAFRNIYFIRRYGDRYSDEAAKNLIRLCSVKIEKGFFKYLGWIPRYLELFSEIRKVRKIYMSLNVPGFVFISKNDELVSETSADILRKNKNLHVRILSESSHSIYSREDYEYLLSSFKSAINSNL